MSSKENIKFVEITLNVAAMNGTYKKVRESCIRNLYLKT